jgi:hypothetical protein
VSGANDFVVLKSLKEKRGILTGNLTTPYIFNWGNLKAGPLVVEYPAGKTAGAFLDFWQRPVADLGLTGPDQGNGATYIIVGPEDDPKKYQKEGVFVRQASSGRSRCTAKTPAGPMTTAARSSAAPTSTAG